MQFDAGPMFALGIFAVGFAAIVGVVLIRAESGPKHDFAGVAATAGWHHREEIDSQNCEDVFEYFAPKDEPPWELRILYRGSGKMDGPLQRSVWTARASKGEFDGFMFLGSGVDARLRPDQLDQPLVRASLLASAGETVREPGKLSMFEISQTGLPELIIVTDNESRAREAASPALVERYAAWAATRPGECPLMVVSRDFLQLRFEKILMEEGEIIDFVDWAKSILELF